MGSRKLVSLGIAAAMGALSALVAPMAPASGVTPTPAVANVNNPTPWATGDPTFTPPTRQPASVGVNYHAMWSDLSDAGRATMLDRYAAAGVEWVRIDVSWDSLQPSGPTSYDLNGGVAKLQKRLDEVAARGMKSMVMLYWAPPWSSGTTAKNGVPRNADEYGTAAAWMAQHYAGKLQAIEIWNEPDLADFLANRSVVTYTNLLKAAYPKIKAANPNVTVVAGAPTGINTNWYTQMYANGGAHMFDALGIHPYMGNVDEPPTTCNTKYIQYYPCNITNLVNLMKANGDGDRQIWATEYGWSTHDNSTYTAPIPSWKRGVTYANQAKYVIQMQEVLAQWPQVTNSFWYTDRNTANADAQEANYGLLYRDFTPKPGYYAMKCVASGICGPNAVAAPAAPTGLNATAAGQNKIDLTWNTTTGADTYQVFRDGTKVATNLTTPTYTDTGLTAATTYTYTVVAANTGGTSPASATATATTDVAAPAAPTGLNATAAGQNKIDLTWNTTTGADTYQVFRDGTKVATNLTTPTYTDTGLTAATTYTYTVVAANTGGTSPASATATATTDVAAPAAPTGLNATAAGQNKIDLTWNTTTGADTYQVFRDGTKVATNLTTPTYTDTGLTAATTYTYTVVAANTGGTSPASATATATTDVAAPAAPTGLNATAAGQNKIDLTWNTTTGADTYQVFRDGTKVATNLTTPTYTDTGLTAATTYTYKVVAANTGGTSPASATATAITAAAPITSYLKSGAIWRVNDSGANLGTTWRGTGFADSTWRSGGTQIGYGDGDETTLLKWGTNAANKYITYYARTTFDAGSTVGDVKSLNLRALVDDGAIVYLNGQEVWRFNLPTGTVSYTTRASRYIAGTEEQQWRSVSLPATSLRAGTNTVAVEVHNDAPSSSDISLDLELSPQR